jgi:hypothetical protein
MMMSISPDTVEVNVTLPASLAKDLRHQVPARQRNNFVAQAVARELRRLRLQQALDASAGDWQDADHLELADGAAIDRWLAEGRSQLKWDRLSEA